MSTLWHDTEEALTTHFGQSSATVQDALVALALHAPHVLGIGPAPDWDDHANSAIATANWGGHD